MKIVVVYPEYVSEFKQCSVEFVIPVGVFDVSVIQETSKGRRSPVATLLEYHAITPGIWPKPRRVSCDILEEKN